MKRPFVIGAGSLVVLCAITIWWFSPVQRVKRATKSLLSILSLEADTGTAGRQLRRYRLERLLANEVSISSPTEADGVFRRDELDAGYAWLAGRVKQSHFSVSSWQDVRIAHGEATVAALIEGSLEYSGMLVLDGSHEVVFVWQKHEDAWRLVSVRWIKRE